jgi:microcystin-dependent protein
VRNTTTNPGATNYTVTISPISGGGTSVVLPQGAITTIYSDGTNIRAVGSTADRFPVGGIMMWSGTIANIPTGWFLCNGQVISGGPTTPDLRNRFIVGAAQDDAGVPKTNITGTLTQTGGNKDAIVVTHTHTATIASAGLHSHEYFPFGTGIGTGFGVAEAFTESQPARITASAGAHVHTATIDSAGASGDNANLPPYYALAYIMRGPY